MKINNSNIEKYIIEYFECNLSPEEEKILLDTINQNISYKELFNIYKSTYIQPETVIFPYKNNLKKNTSDFIINEWEDICIKYVENVINNNEKVILLNELQEDEVKRKIFEIYKLTKLKPDYRIEFPKKSLLKKTSSKIYYKKIFWYYSLAAAVIGIFFVLNVFIKNSISTTSSYLGKLAILKNEIKLFKQTAHSDKKTIINSKSHQTQKSPKIKELNTNYFHNNDTLTFYNYYAESIENINTENETEQNITVYKGTDTTYNEKEIRELLNKIFTENQYLYNLTFDTTSYFVPKKLNLWALIFKKGTNFITNYTDSKIKFTQHNSEKYNRFELALGNISFSRITSK